VFFRWVDFIVFHENLSTQGDAGAGLYLNDRGIIVLAGIATNNHNDDESCTKPDYIQRLAGSIEWVRSVIFRKINA
jgi:hypothetical protein